MTIGEIIEELKNLEFYNRLFDNSETVDRKTEAVVSAIKGLEELKRQREAWNKVSKRINLWKQDSERLDSLYAIGRIEAFKKSLEIIAEYRPKECDTE